MNRMIRHLLVGLGVSALGLLLLGVAICKAWGQDCREGDFGCQHQQYHHEYKTWRASDGGSCCNDSECRPTRARPTESSPSGWEAWVEGAWRQVPLRALLPPDRLKDGRSHVCSPAYNPDVIYCFSPAHMKM